MAQRKPLWARKGGVDRLNRERTNRSYEFITAMNWGADINRLRAEGALPLVREIARRHGLREESARVDTLERDATLRPTLLRLTFRGEGGGVFLCRVTDEYETMEDNVDQTWDCELHRLYAVSAKDSLPLFDRTEKTVSYPRSYALLSLIPGKGQRRKGEKVKGAALLWGEAALAGTAMAAELKRHFCQRKVTRQPQFAPSWRSKAHSWKQVRDISLCLFGAAYAYNIIDAALGKGAPRVTVKGKDKSRFTLRPVAAGTGLGLCAAWSL